MMKPRDTEKQTQSEYAAASKSHGLKSAALLALIFVAGCSSAPLETSLLQSVRQSYRQAQNNPQLMQAAAAEMRDASDAMGAANNAAAERESAEKIDQYAYLAQQKISLAQEVLKQKNAEAEIKMAGQARQGIQWNQRTEEVKQAQLHAAQSDMDKHMANDETHRVRQEMMGLQKNLADLKAKQTDRGPVIILDDFLFGTDDARLKPEGIRMVQRLSQVLQENPQQKVLIEGYTDSTGSRAHNQQLSERRAGAVSSALQLDGIASTRIIVRGHGEDAPAADNTNAENRQRNRRVEVLFSDLNGNFSSR